MQALWARVKGAFRMLFGARAAFDELGEQQRELKRRFDELNQAHAQIAAQAEQLRTVNVLGRELAKHTDLKALADSLSKLLIERFRCTGLQFWRARSRGDPLELLKEAGERGLAEPRRFSLQSSGEMLGRVDVWGYQSPAEGGSDLLEALVPWITMAVENARNFGWLRQYQLQLEQKVSQRTAELKRTSEQLAQSLEKLRELDRQKTEFFANASHELRTPLTLLLAPLETLIANGSLSSGARDEISGSLRNAYRLLKLINDLLDLSKIEAGRMELRIAPVNLTRILKQTIEPWRATLSVKSVQFDLSAPAELPLMGDSERLEQVALNLISNAVKHTPRGGWIRASAEQRNGEVEFSVENSGEGIEASEIGQLFERFGQSAKSRSRRFGSTGLGLPVVRDLVKLHGGEVSVDSVPGESVAFRVRLPVGALPAQAADAEAPQPTASEVLQYQAVATTPEEGAALEEETDRKKPLLLIAEDNADLRAFLVRNLRRDFAILQAHQGIKALELARQHLPDLVLSDLMMPGMDGIELCRELKKVPITMGIPFILLTARADLEGKLTGLQAGADDYLIKPFHFEEVKARLKGQLRLKSLAENIAQNEKLAALGILVAGVAHEVRNPLNGIINSLSPLKEMLAGDPVAIDLLDLAISSARRVDQISLQLLQQARAGEGIKAEIDLISNVGLAVQLLSHKTTVGPQIVSNLSTDDNIRVVAEPGALNQVWINLIDNAIHAAGPSGQVEVSVDFTNNTAEVEVADNGPGIDPQIVKRIFDPFFTTKPVGSGTGLGLSMVREIIEKHGGQVAVQSNPGQGSRFKVSLPAVRIARGEAYVG